MKRDNPELFEDEDDTALRIGSSVDCLLTSPDRWNSDFVVGDVFKPYGMMATFVRNLPSGLTLDSPQEVYLKAYEKAGYKKGIDWVISQFTTNEKLVEYYLWLTSRDETKIYLSKDEYSQVRKCVEAIKSNDFTLAYFVNTNPDVELLHQVQILFDFYVDEEKFECKALLDGIKIDHAAKTIEPFDLKTTGKSVWEFASSYLHWGYYRQCAFYVAALLSDASPIKKYLDEGYELLDFVFIVVETKQDSYNPAVIYRTSPQDRYCGTFGGMVGDRYYPGIIELLKAYKWHTENDYWELPRSLYGRGGVMDLNVF